MPRPGSLSSSKRAPATPVLVALGSLCWPPCYSLAASLVCLPSAPVGLFVWTVRSWRRCGCSPSVLRTRCAPGLVSSFSLFSCPVPLCLRCPRSSAGSYEFRSYGPVLVFCMHPWFWRFCRFPFAVLWVVWVGLLMAYLWCHSHLSLIQGPCAECLSTSSFFPPSPTLTLLVFDVWPGLFSLCSLDLPSCLFFALHLCWMTTVILCVFSFRSSSLHCANFSSLATLRVPFTFLFADAASALACFRLVCLLFPPLIPPCDSSFLCPVFPWYLSVLSHFPCCATALLLRHARVLPVFNSFPLALTPLSPSCLPFVLAASWSSSLLPPPPSWHTVYSVSVPAPSCDLHASDGAPPIIPLSMCPARY